MSDPVHDRPMGNEPDPGVGYEGVGEIRLRDRKKSSAEPGWGFGGGGRGGGGTGARGPRGLKFLAAGLGFVLLLATLLAVVRRPNDKEATSDSPPDGPATRSFTLYFLDRDGELVAETREVAAKASPTAQVHAVIAEEIAGSIAGMDSPIPKETELLHLFVSPAGLVTIDLSREVVRNHPGDMESEFATISALVRIVRDNFPELIGIQILVEGNPVPTLAGHFTIESPLFGEEWR